MVAAALYFAYGSNMLSARLCAEERAPSAVKVALATLHGHRLTFDKLGQDGSGKCHIETSDLPHAAVHGVVFQIQPADWPKLDAAEDLGHGYERIWVSVRDSDRTLACLTYRALRRQAGLRPFHWYKQLVLAGASEHGLPQRYQDALRRVESVQDENAARRSRYASLIDRWVQ